MSAPTELPRSGLVNRRAEIVDVLKRFHVTHAGVFGYTARGEDAEQSGFVLIVEFASRPHSPESSAERARRSHGRETPWF